MKFRIFCVLCLTSVTALIGDAFQDGIDAYHDAEYAAAAEAFEKAIAESETATAHHNLALALYQQGKVSESLWHLERALRFQPRNEQYYFKLGALRQQVGLPNPSPGWYEIASQVLSQKDWIIMLSIAFWTTIAAFWLPKASGCRVSLYLKAVRLIGLVALMTASSALYLNRDLASRGIILGDNSVALHAAPASAAPQVGLARPGERGQKVDQHGKYVEIKTEGGARGWVNKDHYRLLDRVHF